jgi:hypothetical protein
VPRMSFLIQSASWWWRAAVLQIVRGVREQIGIQLEKLQRLMDGLCQHLGDFCNCRTESDSRTFRTSINNAAAVRIKAATVAALTIPSNPRGGPKGWQAGSVRHQRARESGRQHEHRREDEVPPPPDKIVMAGGIAK